MFSVPFFSAFISCKPVITTGLLHRSLMNLTTTMSDGKVKVNSNGHTKAEAETEADS